MNSSYAPQIKLPRIHRMLIIGIAWDKLGVNGDFMGKFYFNKVIHRKGHGFSQV
jgi:hypothetical protein